MHPKATVVAVVVATAALAVPLGRALAARQVPAVSPARFCRVRLAMAKEAAQRAAAVGLPVRLEAVLDLAALPALLAPRAGIRAARAQVARGS